MIRDELPAILIVFVVMGLGVVGNLIWESHVCSQQAEAMMMQSRYEVATGCMVLHERGHWIPMKAYRVVD
jgi:hypothetical protein